MPSPSGGIRSEEGRQATGGQRAFLLVPGSSGTTLRDHTVPPRAENGKAGPSAGRESPSQWCVFPEVGPGHVVGTRDGATE